MSNSSNAMHKKPKNILASDEEDVLILFCGYRPRPKKRYPSTFNQACHAVTRKFLLFYFIGLGYKKNLRRR